MRAPPKTAMSLPCSRLSSGTASSTGARVSRALFQVTSSRLWEKTTFGSAFISSAIGSAEPDPPRSNSS